HRLRLGSLRYRPDRQVGEQLLIVARDRPAGGVPLVEVVQLDVEDSGLQCIEPAVVAGHLVDVVAVASSVVAQLAYPTGQLRVVRDDCSCVSERTEVLAGIEAETSGMAERADPASFPPGAVGLGGILDHRDPCPVSHIHDFRHVHGLAVEMNRHHGGRPLVEGFCHAFRRQEEGLGVDVHQTRGSPYRLDGRDRGHERVRRDYHLVARADAERRQGDAQRIRAVGDPDRLAGLAVFRPPALEVVHVTTADEARGRQGRIPSLLETLGQRSMHCCEVQEGDSHTANSSAPLITWSGVSSTTGTSWPDDIAKSPASRAATTASPLSPGVRGGAPVVAHSMKWLNSFIRGSDVGTYGETMLPYL